MFTAYDSSFASLAEISVPTMRRYCENHGIDFRAFPDPEVERPRAWAKIPLAETLFGEGYDFVWWIDADAMFVRFDADFREQIDPGADFYFVEEPNAIPGTESRTRLNSGVFALRNSPIVREFLRDAWAQEDLVHHEWWDQAGMIAAFGFRSMLCRPHHRPDEPVARYADRLRRLPTQWNAGMGLYAVENPIVVHFMGMAPAGKRICMRMARALAAMPEEPAPGATAARWSALHAIAREIFFDYQRNPFAERSPAEINAALARLERLDRHANDRGWLLRRLWTLTARGPRRAPRAE